MHKCCQCGKETDFMELQNGKWGCLECCNAIGVEQQQIRDLIAKEVQEYDEKSIISTIDSMLKIINFCYSETSIETIPHLLKSLEAIKIYYEIIEK